VETSGSGAAASRAFRHTYLQPGIERQITVTATDKDGGIGQFNLQGEVEAPDLVVSQFGQEKHDFPNHTGRFQVFPGTETFDGLSINIDHDGPAPVISASEPPAGFTLRDAPTFPLTIDDNTGSIDVRIQANGMNPSLLKGRVKIFSNNPDESPFSFYVSSSVGSLPDLLDKSPSMAPETARSPTSWIPPASARRRTSSACGTNEPDANQRWIGPVDFSRRFRAPPCGGAREVSPRVARGGSLPAFRKPA
jgi:hypothetical protein